eukprot:2804612-Prymnesium_polylepis.1
MLAKGKSSPDDFNQRQMSGPEWDEPKQLEIAKIKRLEAADDPAVQGLPISEMLWVGRAKRNAEGDIWKMNA